MVPRLVLISDGKENAGSITRAAWQAQSLRHAHRYFALSGRPDPTCGWNRLAFPPVRFTGERFPVDLTVVAPRRSLRLPSISAPKASCSVPVPITLEAGAIK